MLVAIYLTIFIFSVLVLLLNNRNTISFNRPYCNSYTVLATKYSFLRTFNLYVEIKCQLNAKDDLYCRSYCLLNMFRAPLCPSSGAREYCTEGYCLWYLVLWFSSCRYGVELRVVCLVCGLLSKQ